MDFRLLGPLDAVVDGSAVSLGGSRQRLLLAALLLRSGTVTPVDRLADWVWEDPPVSARANIRTYVMALRKALRALDESEPRLRTDPAGYVLDAGSDELDVSIFDGLAEQGEAALARDDTAGAAALFEEALALWRGEPLEGLPLTLPLRTEAQRLQERRFAVVERYVDARLDLGRHQELVPELWALVAEHPLRERYWSQLVLALYRSGRQADALAAYGQARSRLVEELGIDPGPELRQREQQILRGDPDLESPSTPDAALPGQVASPVSGAPARRENPPRQLPPDIATFTGREQEVAWWRHLLGVDGQRGATVIGAVYGPGGCGKSSLAVRSAHDVHDQFPDGQLYVDLRGSTPASSPLDPLEVLSRFLRALGTDDPVAVPTDVEEVTARFRSLVADRRILVVLDNAASTEQVRSLLPSGSGCAVIVTSRRMLEDLDGASHLGLGRLSSADGVSLLGRLAGADRVAADPDGAERLARQCGRLPLALRIAGARLAARPAWPIASLVDRLEVEQARLDELRAGNLAVRASFHVSYAELADSAETADAEAARAFRLLGLLEAADVQLPTVAALLDVDTGTAERLLDRVVDAQLVESPAPGQYRVHDLLHAFARERALRVDPQEQRWLAFDRVIRWYLATVQRAVTLVHPNAISRVFGEPGVSGMPLHSRDEALAWLESQRSNFLGLVSQAADAPGETGTLGCRLGEALFWYLFPRSLLHELKALSEVCLPIAQQRGDIHGQAYAHYNVAAAYYRWSCYSDALEALESALALFRHVGDTYGEQSVLGALGALENHRGNHEVALGYERHRLELCRRYGDSRQMVTALSNLGETYRVLGDTEQAHEYLTKGLRMGRQLGNVDVVRTVTGNLGLLYLDQGRLSEAVDHIERVLPTMTDLGERMDEWSLRLNASRARRLLGDHQQALRHCDEALPVCREIRERHGEGQLLHERGRVLDALGDVTGAAESWLAALAILDEFGPAEAEEVRKRLAASGERASVH